jgi:predicted DNA-binding protein
MSVTITVRLPERIAESLHDLSKKTGLPVNRIIREQLEQLLNEKQEKPYMKLSGKLKGLPRDLSMREGFGPR